MWPEDVVFLMLVVEKRLFAKILTCNNSSFRVRLHMVIRIIMIIKIKIIIK